MSTTTTDPRIPEDVDGRNEERADWARMALDTYCLATRSRGLSSYDPEEVLTDFLSDLHHLVDRLGLIEDDAEDARDRVDAFLMSGRAHYEAETGRAAY